MPGLTKTIAAMLALLATPALAAAPAPMLASAQSSSQSWVLQPPKILSSREINAEIATLRTALFREVSRATEPTPERRQTWIRAARAEAAKSPQLHLDRPQILVVVDRNETIEELALIATRPDAPWEVIGSVKVSTGQAGRFDHYITPTGTFLHTADILDYRAEGTVNENGVRGLGTKGMRVWDFGWQTATKGWRADGEQGQIRLEMHATDPDLLASRIGRPASQGCIRLPDAMNRFLDRHGILDADYEHAALDDSRYLGVLLPNRTPSPLSGNALVIVDSKI